MNGTPQPPSPRVPWLGGVLRLLAGLLPGWLRRDGRVEPPDVFARAGLTPYAFSVDGVRTPDAFVEAIRRELEQKAARFNRLAEVFELDLGAVVFYASDAAGRGIRRSSRVSFFSPARDRVVRSL